MSNSSSDWGKLSDEYGAADKEVREAWAVVNREFGAIANGSSRENPTSEELDRLHAAKARRDDVDRRMGEFMRVCFGVS